jgi:hypothetical protein
MFLTRKIWQQTSSFLPAWSLVCSKRSQADLQPSPLRQLLIRKPFRAATLSSTCGSLVVFTLSHAEPTNNLLF